MKNKSLKEKLNNYADCLERKNEILTRAYFAMDEKRRAGSYDKRKSGKWKIGGISVAATILLIVVISILSGVLRGGKTPAQPYALNSLQKQSASFEQYARLTDVMVLSGETGQIDARYFIYVNEKEEVCAARAIYKYIREGSVDEIEIISDLENNLSDFKDDKPSDDNPIVRRYDYYKDGEYYSYLAAERDGPTYYIKITSPTRNAGEYYENILLGGQ